MLRLRSFCYWCKYVCRSRETVNWTWNQDRIFWTFFKNTFMVIKSINSALPKIIFHDIFLYVFYLQCAIIFCVCWYLLILIKIHSFSLSCSSHFKIYDYNRRPFCLYLIFREKKKFWKRGRRWKTNERKKIH